MVLVAAVLLLCGTIAVNSFGMEPEVVLFFSLMENILFVLVSILYCFAAAAVAAEEDFVFR